MIYKDFKYKIINNEVAITEYIGNETDVIIPSEIDGFKVTSIGDEVFYCCGSLTSVTIPNGVTSIGKYVFEHCSSLISVTIPNSVTSIGSCTFYACSSLTSVNIPNSVTSIGNRVFRGCELYSKVSNYKAFRIKNNGLYCRDYHFKENEWSDNIDNLELRRRGYHYCTNLFEIFDHYCGVIDEDIVIYECEVGDTVIKSNTSLCVTNKIKPVKRLHREDVIRILNNIK